MDDMKDIMVVDRVERKIKSDFPRWSKEPFGKLPDERELAIEYGASRVSIRRAIERLRDSRLIKTVPRKGNFILQNPAVRKDMLVSSQSSNNFYSLMSLNVIGSILNEHEIGMKVLIDQGNLFSNKEVAGLDPSTCAGMILVGDHKREDVELLVKQLTVPLIYLGELNEKYQVPQICNSVLGDNSALAYSAVEYLLGNGHQRIAAALLDKSASWNKDILIGYQAALERHGLTYDPDLVVDIAQARQEEGLKMASDAQSVVRQIAKWRPKPTAMIHLLMSEIQHEELNTLFKGYFSRGNIIPLIFKENLELQYSGRTSMTAFCIEYAEIVRRAVERVLNPEPLSKRKIFTREMLSSVSMYRREKGVWSRTES